MGKFEQGSLGDFHGKTGNITIIKRGSRYYTAKNQCTNVRHEPSADQLKVQSRFSLIQKSLKPFRVAIRAGFKTSDAAFSPSSQAFKHNYHSLADEQNTSVDYSRLLLSRGGESFDVDLTKGRTGDYELVWTPANADSPLSRATVYLVAFNVAANRAETFRADMSAGSLSASVSSLLTGTADDDIHLYVFAARGTNSSDTRHFHFE